MAKSSPQPESNMLPPWGCNICLEESRDPVCTTCGHLFCWPCLYPWVRDMGKPCPVCRAPVNVDANIVPVYVSTAAELSVAASTSTPPRPHPVIRPPPPPPSQYNIAAELPHDDMDMLVVPAYRATLNGVQVEEAAGRAWIAREEAQITQDLSTVEGDDHNLSRMSRRLKELRTMTNAASS